MKTTGYNEFIEIFGSLTVSSVVQFILAVVFMYAICTMVGKYLLSRYNASKEKDAQLKIVFETVNNYPKYRQQSIDIQKEFTEAIKELQKAQEQTNRRIDIMEENTKKRKVNELRASLLQSYRYYTSDKHNPMKAWTQMEADSFWASFGDYEDLDGDGHMHTVVQPEMRMLTVISMDNTCAISELMNSRK